MKGQTFQAADSCIWSMGKIKKNVSFLISNTDAAEVAERGHRLGGEAISNPPETVFETVHSIQHKDSFWPFQVVLV